MQFDENAQTSPYIKVPRQPRPRRFLSARWRVLTPIVAALMAVLMCGAYGVGYAFVWGGSDDASEDLIAAGRSLAQNAVEVGRTQRTEVDRIAFTQGVPEGILADDGVALQRLTEPLAALANLDLVVIGNASASEVIGLQRVAVSGSVDYAVTSETDLSSIPAVQAVLNGADSASEIVTLERRPMLITAGVVLQEGQVIGVVLVGMDINRVLRAVKGGNNVHVALFGAGAQYLGATFPNVLSVSLDGDLYADALSSMDAVTFERLQIREVEYQAAYFPFVVGETPLGVIAAYHNDDLSFAAEFGRQIMSLFFALVIAAVCIVGYVAVGRVFSRVEKVRMTADRLAAGELVRTGMKPHDEIGEMGAALDRFAAAAHAHIRQLQTDLRQQRRQLAHLNAILENLPDGVVVQDVEGRVMTMNAAARDYLGAYGDTPAANTLRAWSATLEQRVGELLAPGIYALDDSTELRVHNRVLRVEAAAVQSIAEKRIGTVVTLRDVTKATLNGERRDALIEDITQNIHVSSLQRQALEAGTRSEPKPEQNQTDALTVFAQEIANDARSIQRLITDYRDLTLLQPNELRDRHQPISVMDLLIELMEEWRPFALASGVGLEVSLPDEEYHVLGDDRRLAWALGNVIDNAVKYSSGHGQVAVSIKPQVEQSRVSFVIQDQGVGISLDDQPHVFARFYRGKARTADGKRLDVPGTGQGLYLARKVVEAHGGSIALASSPGQGTFVSIALPLTADMMLEIPDTQTSIWDMPTRTDIPMR